jgi:hypothetical protein
MLVTAINAVKAGGTSVLDLMVWERYKKEFEALKNLRARRKQLYHVVDGVDQVSLCVCMCV